MSRRSPNAVLVLATGMALAAVPRGFSIATDAQSPPRSSVANAIVSGDGSGDHRTVQEAINAVPQNTSASNRWIIFIKAGTYREPVYVQREKRFVTLVGEDPARTILTYDLNATMPGPDGTLIGTFRTPSTVIDADDFTAENLTAGARVSFDLNYRGKLWTEAQAQKVVGPLLRDVDVVIANEEDLQCVLGIQVPNTDVAAGRLAVEGFRQAAERVTRDFGPRLVAITLRESVSASDNGWSALFWDADAGTVISSQRYDVRVVDRIGGGDGFAAGLIYGLVSGRSAADALRFAVAASALKHTIPGDFNRVTIDEVDRLARGDASGRVQR